MLPNSKSAHILASVRYLPLCSYADFQGVENSSFMVFDTNDSQNGIFDKRMEFPTVYTFANSLLVNICSLVLLHILRFGTPRFVLSMCVSDLNCMCVAFLRAYQVFNATVAGKFPRVCNTNSVWQTHAGLHFFVQYEHFGCMRRALRRSRGDISMCFERVDS